MTTDKTLDMLIEAYPLAKQGNLQAVQEAITSMLHQERGDVHEAYGAAILSLAYANAAHHLAVQEAITQGNLQVIRDYLTLARNHAESAIAKADVTSTPYLEAVSHIVLAQKTLESAEARFYYSCLDKPI